MKSEAFKNLLKTEEPQTILKDFMFRDLALSDKQLGIVIDLKNKKVALEEVLGKFKKEKRKKNGRRINKD